MGVDIVASFAGWHGIALMAMYMQGGVGGHWCGFKTVVVWVAGARFWRLWVGYSSCWTTFVWWLLDHGQWC